MAKAFTVGLCLLALIGALVLIGWKFGIISFYFIKPK